MLVIVRGKHVAEIQGFKDRQRPHRVSYSIVNTINCLAKSMNVILELS